MAERSANWTDDEIIVATELVRCNGWRDLRRDAPQVVALSELLRSLPQNAEAAEDEKFRSPGSVSRKIADIVTTHPGYSGSPTKGGEPTRRVVEAFGANPEAMSSIARTIRDEWELAVVERRDPLATGDDLDVPSEHLGAVEGRTVLAMHLRRERDRQLRESKIAAVLRAHGVLQCEVCGFDFSRTYGDIGRDYIEVHHVVPLHASGETRTRLTDLATVCSNCHRMIHRRTPWLTPEELRGRMRRVG